MTHKLGRKKALQERKERLEAALRANLKRRRKQQARVYEMDLELRNENPLKSHSGWDCELLSAETG
ncbi:MAG: hypothetical protein PSN37_02350 [Alphaproteobacteria bacterium]|nr:hypothetical protein [Alphaproteobacteria bacterium]